ncbi:MAG: hypothetical protein V3S04_03475 [Candidatus Omnitrophota bacterium]
MLTVKYSKKGISIVFAVFTLLLLSVVALAIFSMVSTDIETAAVKIRSTRTFGIAESGVQIGAQAIADDTATAPQTANPANNGYYGVVYLEGYNSDGNNGSDWGNACFHGTNWSDNTPLTCTLNVVADASLEIWGFEQRSNFIGTRLRNIEVAIRARRAMASGSGRPGASPIIQLEYTTNGNSSTPTWTVAGTSFTVSNGGWGPQSYRTRQIGVPIGWGTFMDSGNFRIRARRTNGGRRRTCQIDSLCLRAEVEIDASSERWYTDWMNSDRTPIDANMAFGGGQISTIAISDESGKININYIDGQTWRLIYYLIRFDIGITRTAEAQAITNEIIAYLDGGDWFDTVEELKQLPSMTDEIYGLIRDDVTVYSWVNNTATRPGTPNNPDARAPININTASKNVLQAFLRCCISGYTKISNIADAIISQRNTQPFTNTFSHYAMHLPAQRAGSFAVFIFNRTDLTLQNKRLILEFADGSYINRSLTDTWHNREQRATELCFYSNAYLITSTGQDYGIIRTVRSVYGYTYDYGTYGISTSGIFNLPTYIGDAAPEAYWREER